MAKYLTTSGISAELENIIKDSKKYLTIISPYLKLSDRVKELLNDKNREKVDVRIIFGKQELAPKEMSFLQNLDYVRLYFSKNLHAKCYLNENKMIISSMNLYEFSQQNNREMGILIDTSNSEDKQVYDDAEKDIQSLMHNSEDFAYAKVPQKKSPKLEKVNKAKPAYNKLLRTKDLSNKTGFSSRKINSWLVDNKLMYKKENQWFITKKGKEKGGAEKEGFYGQEVLWPEALISEIHCD